MSNKNLIVIVHSLLLIFMFQGAFSQESSETLKKASEYIDAGKYDLARPLLIRAAESGDLRAQFGLSNAYERGAIGFTKELEKSNYWLKKAAEGGLADAQYKLGQQSFGKDLELAAKMLWSAANQGHMDAQYAFIDKVTIADEPAPEHIVKQANIWASSGNKALMFWLADNYYFGKKLKKNNEEAANWFRQAAKLGNTKAQYAIGYMYDKGEGVKMSQKEARQWLQLAASKNFDPAIKHLAQMDKDKQKLIQEIQEVGEKIDKLLEEATNISQ